MAFVPPLAATQFLGARTTASVSRPRFAAAAASRPSAPRMAFSSIDNPESTVSLTEPSVEAKALVLTAAYRQIFGNAYLMESERAELARVESDFKNGDLTVAELLRAMAKSNAYRKRFFERAGPYAFVELNCKHFLGRGANSQEEVSFHVQKLLTDGYDAEIDSYFDSAEYRDTFGPDAVPRFVYRGAYLRNDDFNRMNVVRQHWDGCSTSTVSGSTAPGKPIAAKLTMPPGAHCGNPVAIKRGILAGHEPEPIITPQPTTPLNARAPIRVRIKVAENSYQVFEVPGYTDPAEPDWKKELAGTKKWNGVWY